MLSYGLNHFVVKLVNDVPECLGHPRASRHCVGQSADLGTSERPHGPGDGHRDDNGRGVWHGYEQRDIRSRRRILGRPGVWFDRGECRRQLCGTDNPRGFAQRLGLRRPDLHRRHHRGGSGREPRNGRTWWCECRAIAGARRRAADHWGRVNSTTSERSLERSKTIHFPSREMSNVRSRPRSSRRVTTCVRPVPKSNAEKFGD